MQVKGELGMGEWGGWADLLMPAGSLTEVSGQQRFSNATLVGLKRVNRPKKWKMPQWPLGKEQRG